MRFFKKVKGFLLEPSKTFASTKREKLHETIIYYAGIAAVNIACWAVIYVFVLRLHTEISKNIEYSVGHMFLAFISTFLFGVLLHIYVYIIGGRKGITQTIKAVIYSSTPGLLLGWTIFLIPIAAMWSLVLVIVGIRQLHEITIVRAILAVFFPLIVVVVFLASLIVSFWSCC